MEKPHRFALDQILRLFLPILCLFSLLIVVAAPANSVIKTAACAVPSPFRPPFVDLRKYVDIDGGSGVARSELPTFAILLARGLSSPSIHP
jgi:hypothetical protein